MAKKQGAAKKRTSQAEEAGPSRPNMPADYGIPKDKKGLLPWSHVSERMGKAMHYWICTVSPGGHPYSTPVDGLWLEDRLYFGGSPETRWRRNLAANPAVSVHLESATDVVILRGEAHELKSLSRPLTTNLAKASREKYGYAMTPEQYEAAGVQVFRPRVVLAWTQFPKDATRWQVTPTD